MIFVISYAYKRRPWTLLAGVDKLDDGEMVDSLEKFGRKPEPKFRSAQARFQIFSASIRSDSPRPIRRAHVATGRLTALQRRLRVHKLSEPL
jgi:hypothetical protein